MERVTEKEKWRQQETRNCGICYPLCGSWLSYGSCQAERDIYFLAFSLSSGSRVVGLQQAHHPIYDLWLSACLWFFHLTINKVTVVCVVSPVLFKEDVPEKGNEEELVEIVLVIYIVYQVRFKKWQAAAFLLPSCRRSLNSISLVPCCISW